MINIAEIYGRYNEASARALRLASDRCAYYAHLFEPNMAHVRTGGPPSSERVSGDRTCEYQTEVSAVTTSNG